MGRNLPPRILRLSRSSNIPPGLLKLREEQLQHPSNNPPRLLKLREEQHQHQHQRQRQSQHPSNIPPRLLKLREEQHQRQRQHPSNIPPRLLELREEQHQRQRQHPSNIPPRKLNRRREQHQPNIPPRILKLREEQQSKKSTVTITENMFIGRLQQQSMLLQAVRMHVQHSQEPDQEQKKEQENVLQESLSVDYARLTSFLEKDNSFLTPWNWKPMSIGHSSSRSEKKQHYSMHSKSSYSFNVRQWWVR